MLIVKGEGFRVQWYFGQEKIWAANQDTDSEMKVTSVIAVGDELDFIKRKLFDNVPVAVTKSVNRWTGEMAQFIADNI